MAGQNTIAKTRRESLNLRLDLIRHIRAEVERDMAVRPKRMLTTGCARLVEQTLLCDEHERTLGNSSTGNRTFRLSNFVYAATEMNCSRATASFGFPWNRRAQRIIDFENSRRVSK